MRKVVGIVCEYNPFHTGHRYHIEAAKARSGADFAVGIMSGYFVQRGELAVLPPSLRASVALSCGLDAVLMLPTVFSCLAGNLFAEGAVRLLAEIPQMHCLAMGTEDDGDTLRRIADLQSSPSPAFRNALRKGLDDGMSYGVAMTQATIAALGESESARIAEVLHKPNNLLAIEYLKAIEKFRLKIRPIFIPRKGNGHDTAETTGETISASAARALLQKQSYDALAPYLPQAERAIQAYRAHPPRKEIYDALLLYALRTNDISKAADATEGIDNVLRDAAFAHADIAAALADGKCKRYPMSRLRRICVQTLLGITTPLVIDAHAACAKLLAARKCAMPLFADMPHVAVRNADFSRKGGGRYADVDALAASIYALVCGKDGIDFLQDKFVPVD